MRSPAKRAGQAYDGWYLRQRNGVFYRARYNPEKRQVDTVSLHTGDLKDAQERLETWWFENRKRIDDPEEVASVADILGRYYRDHASVLPSASGNLDAIKKWVNYWEDAKVSDLSIYRQEEFLAHLGELGLKPSSVQRTVAIGRAGLNWARKRGELKSVPFIKSVSVKGHPPMGRPLEVSELQRLYDHAADHLKVFILWMTGTAARPGPIIELTSDQIEWENGLVRLNADGREQNKKHRPTVKLPPSLAHERFEGRLISYRGGAVSELKTAWRAARCRAKLDENVRAYSLRHTAARWMRKNGVPHEEVAQQLGHRKLGVTGIYTEYDPQYLEKACEALDRLCVALRGTTRNPGNLSP